MLSATVTAHWPDQCFGPRRLTAERPASTALASAGGRTNPKGRNSRQKPGAILVSRPDLRRSGRLGQHRQTRETPMNVAKWVLSGLLMLPFLELAAFIAVAAAVGFGWALALILASSLAGALILRHAGGNHVARVRVAISQGSFTALQADGSGCRILLAGILLLIPGFITDAVGLVVLTASFWRRTSSVNAANARNDGVVDLAPEQWHQIPDPTLPDRHKDERDR